MIISAQVAGSGTAPPMPVTTLSTMPSPPLKLIVMGPSGASSTMPKKLNAG